MVASSLEITEKSDSDKLRQAYAAKLEFLSARQKSLARAIELNQEEFEKTERLRHQLDTLPEEPKV